VIVLSKVEEYYSD